MQAGLATYEANQCGRLVLAGGAVANRHVEAETMAELARELGAPEQDLIIESRARTTWENVGCALPLMTDYDRTLIVSDSLHVYRAKRYACRQNPSLCSRVYAIGGYRPLVLWWWKVPAAAHELYARLRDFFFMSGQQWMMPHCAQARLPCASQQPQPSSCFVVRQ